MSDYISLFKNSNTLQGGDFCCTLYPESGTFPFPEENPYPMIFVLQGEVEMLLLEGLKTVKVNNLVIINRSKLMQFSCKENTVVLKYIPPKRLSDYFERCWSALHLQCSAPIKIMPPLEAWVDSLLKTLAENAEMDEDTCCVYRRQLAAVLKGYPQKTLEELYAPFYVCSSLSCQECHAQGGIH